MRYPQLMMCIVLPMLCHGKLRKQDLLEGSECKGPGYYCTNLYDCPRVLSTFHARMAVNWDAACSQLDRAEGPLLVCCKEVDIVNPRSSVKACRNYGEEISRTHGIVQQIKNGKKAESGEFPHLAALGYNDGAIADLPFSSELLRPLYSPPPDSSDISWRCSGSLISHDWVLTAAHCVIPSLNWVRLGAVSLDDVDDQSLTVFVAEKLIHPNYGGGYNDIALLRLSTRIASFKDNIRPACLHQTDKMPCNELSVVGYGRSGPQGLGPINTLNKGYVRALSINKCQDLFKKKIYTKQYYKHGFTQDIVCARDLRSYQDTCEGDSGGPLQVQDALSGRYMYSILGVTSVAFEHCNPWGMKPTTYTKVSRYLTWIEAIVWNSSLPVHPRAMSYIDNIIFTNRLQ